MLMIHEHNIAIDVDTENRTILAFTLEEGEVLKETEGILNEVASSINEKIAKHFNINTIEYGIESCSENYSMTTK
ncbi:hypothetical protein [Sulfurimonas sp.]|uniref:hypothetical protein n=1 Tax=Sulfurimonas sp. TaxID=2022749 RepID=UPI0025EAD1A7|nr:hypothetical protein [Sulfurimonas sp.]